MTEAMTGQPIREIEAPELDLAIALAVNSPIHPLHIRLAAMRASTHIPADYLPPPPMPMSQRIRAESYALQNGMSVPAALSNFR